MKPQHLGGSKGTRTTALQHETHNALILCPATQVRHDIDTKCCDFKKQWILLNT